MNKNLDYIIVGQGIAGSMVAHFLLKQQKKILVIDKFNPNAASNIAAGVVNPITGRKMVKTWRIDEVLPFAKKTYRELEQQLNTSFFYEQEIYKLFSSTEDIDIWNKRKSDPEYKDYLGGIVDSPDENITAPYGAGIIKQSCWMDVPLFTKTYRSFLTHHNYLLEEDFDFKQLKTEGNIEYKNIIADKIIFCEGYKAYLNPFFSKVPFSLAKGEYLLIHAPTLKTDKIINKNIFMIPKGNNLYNTGSTFSWDDMNESVTENGRNEIIDKLEKIINIKYSILEEKAGIRPTIKDRRPVIGNHPLDKNVYIFNGMGTKGVSLAPFFASYFTDCINNNIEFFHEISVNRFVV